MGGQTLLIPLPGGQKKAPGQLTVSHHMLTKNAPQRTAGGFVPLLRCGALLCGEMHKFTTKN